MVFKTSDTGSHDKGRRYEGGFSLIELMIVLIIAGLLIGSALQAYTVFIAKEKQETMDNRLDEVRRTLAGYIQDEKCEIPDNPATAVDETNPEPDTTECMSAWTDLSHLVNESDHPNGTDAVRFPCPADPTLGPGDANFGVEQCGGGGVINSGGVLIGSVPFRTLGLSVEDTVDPHNNRFTYAVSQNVTTPGALAGGTNPTGNLVIEDDSGGTTNTHFTLVSHGEDGSGAWTYQGTRINCGGGSAGDRENCNDDNRFRFQRGLTQGTGDYYDDRAAYTLVDETDDEWWYAVNGSGDDIKSRNPGDVVASGDFRTSSNVKADKNVEAGQDVIAGNDMIADRNITAKNDLVAENNILSGNDIRADRDITASRNLIARGNVVSEGYVSAVGNVLSQKIVRANQDVIADRDVKAKRNVISKNNIISDGYISAGGNVLSQKVIRAKQDVKADRDIRASRHLQADKSVFGQNFFYSENPRGRGGGSSKRVCDVGNKVCPKGQVLRGFSSNCQKICDKIRARDVIANFSCRKNQFVTGFRNGKPVCGKGANPKPTCSCGRCGKKRNVSCGGGRWRGRKVQTCTAGGWITTTNTCYVDGM